MPAQIKPTYNVGEFPTKNDIKNLAETLISPVIGRAPDGTPIAGKKLGNLEYQWRKVYCQQLNFGSRVATANDFRRATTTLAVQGTIISATNYPEDFAADHNPALDLTFNPTASATAIVIILRDSVAEWEQYDLSPLTTYAVRRPQFHALVASQQIKIRVSKTPNNRIFKIRAVGTSNTNRRFSFIQTLDFILKNTAGVEIASVKHSNNGIVIPPPSAGNISKINTVIPKLSFLAEQTFDSVVSTATPTLSPGNTTGANELIVNNFFDAGSYIAGNNNLSTNYDGPNNTYTPPSIRPANRNYPHFTILEI